MIESYVVNYIVVFMMLEFYEVWFQKAETLLGMLARMYKYYSKSVWLFLMMQPTFYFAVGFMMLTDYNVYSVVLFVMKSLDIGTKIMLVKKIFIDQEISPELTQTIVAPLNKAFIYMGLVIYPILIYLTLS